MSDLGEIDDQREEFPRCLICLRPMPDGYEYAVCRACLDTWYPEPQVENNEQ